RTSRLDEAVHSSDRRSATAVRRQWIDHRAELAVVVLRNPTERAVEREDLASSLLERTHSISRISRDICVDHLLCPRAARPQSFEIPLCLAEESEDLPLAERSRADDQRVDESCRGQSVDLAID